MSQLITIDLPTELSDSVHDCLAWSEKNKIATADQFQATANHRNLTRDFIKQVEDQAKPRIKQAYDLHKALCADLKALIAPAEKALALDNAELERWKKLKDAEAEAERNRIQAIADEAARKAREKEEAEAAKQRAVAAEKERKAAEARKAAEEASEKDRAKLLAKAAAAQAAANAAQERAEDKEATAAQIVAPTVAAAPEVKAEGIAFRKTWKAKIVNEAQLWEFICANKRRDLIEGFNGKVLDALAKALKSQFSIPGCVAEEVIDTAKSR